MAGSSDRMLKELVIKKLQSINEKIDIIIEKLSKLDISNKRKRNDDEDENDPFKTPENKPIRVREPDAPPRPLRRHKSRLDFTD